MTIQRQLLAKALSGSAINADDDYSNLQRLESANDLQNLSLNSTNFGGGAARGVGALAQVGTALAGAYARSKVERSLQEKEIAAQNAFAAKYPQYADLAAQLSPATREAFALKDIAQQSGFSNETDPASVREYNYFKNLPEDEQKKYLGLKRTDPASAAYAREQAKLEYAAPIEEAKMRGKGEVSDIEKRDVGRKQVNLIADRLVDSYKQLQTKGATIDPSQSPYENLVARVRATGVGQGLGNAFGTEEQSVRNQIKSQIPALINSIRSATGMSAKAMDSNAELQFYLKQATDEKVDLPTNLRALQTVKELYGAPIEKSRVVGGKNTNSTNAQPSLDQIFKQ